MRSLSHLPTVFLGAALAFAPALGMAQKTPAPETAIPRHTNKGGHGNFVPPRDRKLPPDPHHDIPAHPNRASHAGNGREGKNGGTRNGSTGSAGGESNNANPQ